MPAPALSLEGRFAQKKGEFEQGIGRLWGRDDLPAAVADYVALVRQFNPERGLSSTPVTAVAQMLLPRRTSCACSSCTRPTTASSVLPGRGQRRRGLRQGRLDG